MNLVNNKFMEFLDKFVVIIDDLLVYSPSKEDHKQHLLIVLDKLQEPKVYSKFKKSEISLKEVEFYGHVLSIEGLSINYSMIGSITKWKAQPM